VDLNARLNPVLAIATTHAREVDAQGRYPVETVAALRESGLLGLTLPTEVGGLGAGPHELVEVLSALAGACGSTAMIYLMHVAAAMPVAAAPPPGLPKLLDQLADGSALGSLAFSESGSRSHFWAPVSRATTDGDRVRIQARKSWVTSAGHADVYVVSTGSADAEGVDLYALPADTPGLEVAGPWRGMGLRGNASAPMTLDATVPADHRLGDAGSGFAAMMQTVLPWFDLGNASVSVGLSRAAVDAAVAHTSASRLEHLDQTAGRLVEPRDDTMLHVLGVKAGANDAALRITDAAMRVCGGAAFSDHLQLDRYFRDARAGHVMAPTADVLYDFYGKAITGQPLF